MTTSTPSSLRQRGSTILGVLVLAGVIGGLTACKQDAGSGAVTAPVTTATTKTPVAAPTPDEIRAQLMDRGAAIWEARKTEDWATVYELRAPVEEQTSLEEYVEWASANEPFKTLEYELGDVAVEGDMGWVQITSTASIRQFPQAPAQETTRWERWQRYKGAWYPVPPEKFAEFPAAPAERIVSAERTLRDRFQLMFNARQANDVETLWELTHPTKRPAEVPSASKTPPFTFLSMEIRWVEVIEARGRVAVVYTVKVNDPSMDKLPAQEAPIIEEWGLADGVWHYLP